MLVQKGGLPALLDAASNDGLDGKALGAMQQIDQARIREKSLFFTADEAS